METSNQFVKSDLSMISPFWQCIILCAIYDPNFTATFLYVAKSVGKLHSNKVSNEEKSNC